MNLRIAIENNFLPFVIKPGRYIGNELGVRTPSSAGVRVLLAIPGLYDQRATRFEVQSWYNLINRLEGVGAERAFLPAEDAISRLKSAKIPLFSLESFQTAGDFDALLFLADSPLDYPNILTMLELAGMSPLSNERKEGPLVIGAGRSFEINPLPMADFIDAFILSPADKLLNELARALASARTDRNKCLNEMAKIAGVFIPQKESSYTAPEKSAAVMSPHQPPGQPLVPLVEVEQDRLSLGCESSYGDILSGQRRINCDPAEFAEKIRSAVKNSGFETVRLDFSMTENCREALEQLGGLITDRRYVLELDNFPFAESDLRTVEKLAKTGRNKIKFEPVASSQRLRQFTGSQVSGAEIEQAIVQMSKFTFHRIKLKFILGFPGEVDEDLNELALLLNRLHEIQQKGRKIKQFGIELNFNLSRPNSVWQWDEVTSIGEMLDKAGFVRKNSPRNLKISFPEPAQKFREGILLRGDRKVGRAILHLRRQIESKTESAASENLTAVWESAFELAGIDSGDYSQRREFGQKLPWERFIADEYKMKLRQIRQAGSAPTPKDASRHSVNESTPELPGSELLYGRTPKLKTAGAGVNPSQSRIRAKWIKTEKVRYTSHLDVVRMFEKAVRRADFPVSLSEGFHPHPKIAYGPPLPLGFTSDCEFLDFQLDCAFNKQLVERLNSTLPEGFAITEAKPVFTKSASLSSYINTSVYQVQLNGNSPESLDELKTMPDRSEIWISRNTPSGEKKINLHGLIQKIQVEGNQTGPLINMWLGLGPNGYARPQEVLQIALGWGERELSSLKFKRIDLLCRKQNSYLSPFNSL
ncbi:MAG: TIGR03936 family radical SAM-associated protein [candidate division Zixibacteria bacterium]|nr:TIGR03936 family radical SAM-associated protein [candidate division Zixibacteria bacterium]